MDTAQQTMQEAHEINRGSRLGIEFLSLSTLSEQEARAYGPDHPETEATDDGGVTGYYFNYPYNSTERRLTQVRLRSNEYHFYGIKVDNNVSVVEDVMKEKNYSKIENIYTYKDTNTRTYAKHHIIITFETGKESNNIISILISAYDPDTPNVVN